MNSIRHEHTTKLVTTSGQETESVYQHNSNINALQYFLFPPAYIGEGSNMTPGCDVCLSVCLSVIIDQEPIVTRVLPVGEQRTYAGMDCGHRRKQTHRRLHVGLDQVDYIDKQAN